ncbi:MAG: hypothetical protein U0Z17_03690 [Bacteroidales bacterium]
MPESKFCQIISNNQAGTGPESFTITTGWYSTYVWRNADSRIEAPGSSTVLLWRLNQVKDINGNYIDTITMNTTAIPISTGLNILETKSSGCCRTIS